MKHSRFNHLTFTEDGMALLFNTAKETLVELDAQTLKQYEDNELDCETQAAMAELGFLVGDDVDELELLESIWRSNFEDATKLDLTIMVTNACNFRCPYCYQDHVSRNMTEAKTQSLLKYLRSAIDGGVKTVDIHWFGGEPLINTAPIFYIEHFLKENKIDGHSSITTNGYLLTEDLLIKLKKETRIRVFQITLDGIEEIHNKSRIHASGLPTYRKICDNIIAAARLNFFIIIRLNMTKENQNLDPFLEEINKLGIPRSNYAIHVINAHEFSNSEKRKDFYFNTAKEYSEAYDKAQDAFSRANYKFLRNTVKKSGCIFESYNAFLIGTDLRLYFCSSCECTSDYELGYIDDDGQKHVNAQYWNRINNSVFNDAECRECIVLPLCMGACTYCRLNGKKFCIPEKYFLDKYIKNCIMENITRETEDQYEKIS